MVWFTERVVGRVVLCAAAAAAVALHLGTHRPALRLGAHRVGAGLHIEVTGSPRRRIQVFGGTYDGPHFPFGASGVWTSVPSEVTAGRHPVRVLGEGMTDGDGRLATDLAGPIDPAISVIQCTSTPDPALPRPDAVSPALARREAEGVAWPVDDGEFFGGPSGWAPVLSLAVIALIWSVLARVPLPRGRWRAVAVAAVIAILIAERADVTRTADWEWQTRMGIPLWHHLPPASPTAALSPLDRTTVAGFDELIQAIREQVPPAASLRVQPEGDDYTSQLRAMQVAWLVWPRPVTMVPVTSTATRHRGWLLSLRSVKPALGVDILKSNGAGALVNVAATAESR